MTTRLTRCPLQNLDYMVILIMTTPTFKLDVLPSAIATTMVDYNNADVKATKAADTKAAKLDTLCHTLIDKYPTDTVLYMVSDTTEGSLASPELYNDQLTVCTSMLPKHVRDLIAIDPATMAAKLPDGSKNPERVKVMDAKKQPASKLKDIRNSVKARLKAMEREGMSEEELDNADSASALSKFREQWANLGKRADKLMTESELASIADNWRQISKIISAMKVDVEPSH